MENFFKKALDKVIKKTGEVNSVEEYNEEFYEENSNTCILDIESASSELDKENPVNLIKKNEELEELESDLDEIEDNEIYYMELPSRLQEIQEEIEEIKIQKTQVPKKTLKELEEKILELQKSYDDLALDLENKEYIKNYNPEMIEKIQKELEVYTDFIESYYDQSDNYFAN
jgi:chromosome segregation ATPase